MKASETTLRNLLEGGRQYHIPFFQRPYSWSEREWGMLWDDVINLYVGDTKGDHFLGPVVTQYLPSTPEVSQFLVIDGQQRMVTLTVILSALRDHVRDRDAAVEGEPKLAKEINDLYLTNPFETGEDAFKVQPTEFDRSSYQGIVAGRAVAPSSRIRKAYEYFRARLTNESGLEYDVVIEPERLKNLLVANLAMVSITLDQDDNPYLIFESLNHKGTPLSQADLIRNYFFMRLPKENHRQVYENVWLPMQRRFEHCAASKFLDEMTNAFWYYLRKDGQRSVVYYEVYDVLKERIEASGGSVLPLLHDLARFAEYYLRIRFPEEEPRPALAKWFRRFLRLDFTTSYPFLLNLYRDLEDKRLTTRDVEKALAIVESYFVRRIVVGIPTNPLNRVFNLLYQELDRGSILTSLRTRLLQFERSQAWPDDDWFRRGIVERPIYSNARADRVKLLLEAIEESLTKEVVDPANLTVEHIMPQTLTDQWRSMLGENAGEIHRSWLDTMGNLTLTGYNPEMSNKPFVEKRAFYDQSGIRLNKHFKGLSKWTPNEIRERATELAEVAVKVWRR